MRIEIIRATADRVAQYNDLIAQSKAVWNWPSGYLECAIPLLAIDGAYIERSFSFELRRDGALAGFFAAVKEDRDLFLDHLWIAPAALRCGLGGMAVKCVMQLASCHALNRICVWPDPPAVGFYTRVGFSKTTHSRASRVPNGPQFYMFECHVGARRSIGRRRLHLR